MNSFLKKRASFIILLITLLVTTYLHLWNLPGFPPSISGDEADNGLEVLLLMEAPQLIAFAPSNAGREAMFHYLLMLPMTIFGANAFALRLIPTLAGILIVPLTYRWLRALLPRSQQRSWIALLAAIFVGTSLWELNLSRLGLRGVLLIPCMLAAYYFFWQGYCLRQYRWFVWSGVFLGLAVHTYTASRSLPLAFVLFGLALLIFYRRQAAGRLWFTWQGIIITGLTSLLVFAPLGWYFFNYPGAFIFRSDQVSLQSTYQTFHAHTGQSFGQFLMMTWLENVRWFVEIATPWVQHTDLPLVLRWLPVFFWIGLFRALYLARRHVGAAFLLITFILGILPIFVGVATTMRIVLALPATYALLAIGLYVPVEFLLSKLDRLRSSENIGLSLNIGVSLGALLISLVSALALFQVQHWIGAPPLPTLFDHVFNIAAKEVKSLVLDQRQSVLVPQAIYTFPPAFFLMQEDFPSALPVEDQAKMAQTETISIFWPVEWERWFENKPPSFVLLSPGADERLGYVETVGQWEPTKFVELQKLIDSQLTLPETKLVADDTGRPIGHVIKANREQVVDALRTVPQNPIQVNFQDEITILGYDTWFLSDQALDVGTFWQAQRNLLEDHHFLLQLVDRNGQVRAEKLATFDAPTAAWFPGQLMIDHQIIELPEELQADIYTLKLGLIKANYREQVLTKRGEWMSASTMGNVSLPGPIIPLGLVQVGEPPAFEETLKVNFSDQVGLTGYRLDQGSGPNEYQISLRWQALKAIDKDYTVTIQLLDEQQNLMAQVDKPPLGGAYPTTAWSPDKPILDIYDLQLPEELPAGIYHLAVGVYDLQTLQRLPVAQAKLDALETNLAIVQKIVLD